MVGSRAGFLVVSGLLATLPGSTIPAEAERVEMVATGQAVEAEPWLPSPFPREVLEEAQRRQIELEARGLLHPARSATPPKFVWPLRQRTDFSDPGIWTTVGFVDHDPNYPGYLLDYNGGDRTYDLASGYNHQGTDIVAWPFGWTKVALDQVEIVAGAAGYIVAKLDGNFDRECSAGLDEEREANYVVIAHEDGSMVVYGHLKKGSVTPKAVDEFVEQGEYLGVIGSSGFSGYAHLHLEIADRDGNLVDPFAGPFNSLNAESWWQDQPPYWDSALLAVMTHTREPLLGLCKNQERTWAAGRFAPGGEVFLSVHFRDLRKRHKIKLAVRAPDGEKVESWRFRARPHLFLNGYAVYRLVLPGDAPHGSWVFRAGFQGSVAECEFEVGEFEPLAGVRRVKPNRLRVGSRRKIRILGFGFTKDLVADIQRRGPIEKSVEIRRTAISEKRIVLTVRAGELAVPGPRDIVLTSPDYSQIVVEDAFRVTE